MALLPKVKLKTVVSFPAAVFGGVGVAVRKENGNFYFDLNYSEFMPPVVITDPTNQNALLWNQSTGIYTLVPLSSFGGASPSDSNPIIDGVAAPGVLTTYARGDHVHPIDTSRAPLASPLFIGDPRGPTPSPGDNDTSFATTAFVAAAIAASGSGGVVRGYLSGLVLSVAGATSTFAVAAGVACDSTQANMMALPASISKNGSAVWAVGNAAGSLDTGALSANTWYHVHEIKRIDTGVVDVLTSLSATAPTLPASYTLFRRIGSMKTDASSQWIKFSQRGDEFLWDTIAQDAVGIVPTNTGLSVTCSVPTGVQVNIKASVLYFFVTSGNYCLISSLDQANIAAGSAAGSAASLFSANSTTPSASDISTRTSTAGQLRVRNDATGATGSLYIFTSGYVDRRGRDA